MGTVIPQGFADPSAKQISLTLCSRRSVRNRDRAGFVVGKMVVSNCEVKEAIGSDSRNEKIQKRLDETLAKYRDQKS